jgi:hypothetical protein
MSRVLFACVTTVVLGASPHGGGRALAQDGTSALVHRDGTVVPFDHTRPIQCPGGWQARSYAPAALEGEVALQDLGLVSRGWTDRVEQPHPHENARLDLCLEQSGARLAVARIVVRSYVHHLGRVVDQAIVASDEASAPAPNQDDTYTVPAASMQSERLRAALSGEYLGFALEIPLVVHDGLLLERLVLRGFATAGSSALAYWTEARERRDAPLARDRAPIAGRLTEQDPFAHDAPCGPGWLRQPERYRVGTALIEFDACTSSAGSVFAGHTALVKRLAMTLRDDNPLLGARPLEVSLRGEELAGLLESVTQHHNWCDEFHIRLPEAEYHVITGSAGASCIVDPADQPGPGSGYPFKVRYGAHAPLLGWAEAVP